MLVSTGRAKLLGAALIAVSGILACTSAGSGAPDHSQRADAGEGPAASEEMPGGAASVTPAGGASGATGAAVASGGDGPLEMTEPWDLDTAELPADVDGAADLLKQSEYDWLMTLREAAGAELAFGELKPTIIDAADEAREDALTALQAVYDTPAADNPAQRRKPFISTVFATFIAVTSMDRVSLRDGHDASNDPAKSKTRTEGGKDITETAGSTSEVEVKDGKISLTIELTTGVLVKDHDTGADVCSLKETSKITLKLQACPDAQGRVRGSITLHSVGSLFSASVKESSGFGYDSQSETQFSYVVDDDAELDRTEFETSVLTQAKGGKRNKATGESALYARQLRLSISGSYRGADLTNAMNLSGEAEGSLAGDAGENDGPGSIGKMVTGLNLATMVLMEPAAEKRWKDGTCVELQLEPASRAFSPSAVVNVAITPYQKLEKVRFNAKVTASFEGQESFAPADVEVESTAAFTFKAGTKEGDRGTVTARSKSKRGIGTGTAEYTVSAPLRYVGEAFREGTSLRTPEGAGCFLLPDQPSVCLPDTETTLAYDDSGPAEVSFFRDDSRCTPLDAEDASCHRLWLVVSGHCSAAGTELSFTYDEIPDYVQPLDAVLLKRAGDAWVLDGPQFAEAHGPRADLGNVYTHANVVFSADESEVSFDLLSGTEWIDFRPHPDIDLWRVCLSEAFQQRLAYRGRFRRADFGCSAPTLKKSPCETPGWDFAAQSCFQTYYACGPQDPFPSIPPNVVGPAL